MFCTKCGANNGEVSSFCTNCGAPLDTKPEVAKTNIMKIFKNKIFWGITTAIVLLVLVLVIIKLQPKKINVEEFINITYSGYDGYAKANASIDEYGLYSAIMEAKGSKKKDFDELDSLEALFNFSPNSEFYDLYKCIDSIDLELSSSSNLSNGDNITVDISYDNELAKELKIRFMGDSVSKIVNELEALAQINPFNDLSVSYSGTSPNGYLNFTYEGDTSYADTYYFDADKRKNLRNGDTITISIDLSDSDTIDDGYLLSQKEKQYVVEGLEEYIDDFADLPSDFLDELKAEAQEKIYAYVADSYDVGMQLDDLSYSGYILNTAKPDAAYFNNQNEIHIIYSGQVSHSEGGFRTLRVFYPIKFTNILKTSDDIYYNDSTSVMGSSYINNSWLYYTHGYSNPYLCYMGLDMALSNGDNYKTTCGDGFEVYADLKTISTISDISEDFTNELANHAKELIEVYVANEYNEDSHIQDLSLKGQYLLVAKDQEKDFTNNNIYLQVYSATLYNDNDKFETSEVYFPVEYKGIVSLPNQEYMITESNGIFGYTYLGNTWYFTDGYTDEQQMFYEIITQRQDSYTYELTDGLTEFIE